MRGTGEGPRVAIYNVRADALVPALVVPVRARQVPDAAVGESSDDERGRGVSSPPRFRGLSGRPRHDVEVRAEVTIEEKEELCAAPNEGEEVFPQSENEHLDVARITGVFKALQGRACGRCFKLQYMRGGKSNREQDLHKM